MQPTFKYFYHGNAIGYIQTLSSAPHYNMLSEIVIYSSTYPMLQTAAGVALLHTWPEETKAQTAAGLVLSHT